MTDWADELAAIRCATCEGTGTSASGDFSGAATWCRDCAERAKAIREGCVPREQYDKLKAQAAEFIHEESHGESYPPRADR